jgi:hypothetical protein
LITGLRSFRLVSSLVASPKTDIAGEAGLPSSRGSIDSDSVGEFTAAVDISPISSVAGGTYDEGLAEEDVKVMVVGSPIHLMMCATPGVSSGGIGYAIESAVSLLSHVGPPSGAKDAGVSAALSATIEFVTGLGS